MKTILVIDDEEHIRQLYNDELTEAGYRVATAANAAEAAEFLDKERPDLVTLDIRMEEGPDGVEILRRIKERDRTIPVIMLSAYGEYKQNFGVWASEAYIVKSSSLEELKDKITEFIAK